MLKKSLKVIVVAFVVSLFAFVAVLRVAPAIATTGWPSLGVSSESPATAWPPLQTSVTATGVPGNITVSISIKNALDTAVTVYDVKGSIPKGARLIEAVQGTTDGVSASWSGIVVPAGGTAGPLKYRIDNTAVQGPMSLSAWVNFDSATAKGTAVSPTVEVTPLGEAIDDTLISALLDQVPTWFPSKYGANDWKGTLNEITPEKVANALKIPGPKPKTYNLTALRVNGLGTAGSREQVQFYLKSAESYGVNKLTATDDRLYSTVQLGNHIDDLNHIGIGDYFYNGWSYSKTARTWGSTPIGADLMGPIITRGVLLDFAGYKGVDMVPKGTRITVDDIKGMLARENVSLQPGDVILFYTGEQNLYDPVKDKTLEVYKGTSETGIHLAEARYLAQFSPAAIGSDAWALELLPTPSGELYPVHQLLFVKYGIRIMEFMMTKELAKDKVYEFLFVWTPFTFQGGTAGCGSPVAIK